jgi:hypothetical protein
LVVERSFAWAARFRRLARDYERLSDSLAGYHYFAFAWLMLDQLCKLLNPMHTSENKAETARARIEQYITSRRSIHFMRDTTPNEFLVGI